MRIRPALKVLVLGAALALSVVAQVKADDIYGRIRGAVMDPSGAVVPYLEITAQDIATGLVRTVKTGSDGLYEFVSLPAPATYTVSVVQVGFKRYEVSSVKLSLNQIYVLNIGLELGQATQQVTVEAAETQVEKTSMELGARITGSAIVDLPLNGRNWVTLQQMLPGVVATAGDFNYNFATNGSRAQDNGFLVNGTDANDVELNTPVAIPSPDSIAEVNMITNTINPEYGRNGGAIMNAVTKSGTNRFRGDGFDFYRDPFLNARNFFLPQPDQFHQNQFGGTLGGPIWKNHTFFFFSFQGTRNRDPQAAGRGFAGGTSTVFTASQRNGLFPDVISDVNAVGSHTVSPFPLVGEDGQTYPAGTLYSTLFPQGQIPSADFSPIASKLLATYMPAANLGTNTFNWSPITVNYNYQYIGRIDHSFGPKDAIFGYWLVEQDKQRSDEGFYGGSLPGFGATQRSRIQNMNLTWNHTFSPSMINEARVGYNRLGYNAINPEKPVLPSAFGFTGINPQSGPSGAGLPCIVMGSYQPPSAGCEFGFSLEGPDPRIDQTYQLSDNLSWIKGAHTFKMGFDMRRSEVENPFYYVNNGYFSFSGTGTFSTGDEAADFLLGIPDLYEQSSGGFIDARTQEYYLYFQDQWKVRRNLTVTYGLGWQDNTPQNDIFNGGVAANAYRPGRQSTVYPTAPLGLLFPGDQGISVSTYGNSFRHFAPRLGLAWSPDSAHKWSVRAGAGIYYNQIEEEVTLENLQSPPFSLTDYGIYDVGGTPNFANPFTGYIPSYNSNGSLVGASPLSMSNQFPFTPPAKGDKDVAFNFPLLLRVFDPSLTTPSSYNYNFAIQRELPVSIILQVGYVGHQGRHLEEHHDINPAGRSPGVNPVCAANPSCGPFTLGFGYAGGDPQTFQNPAVDEPPYNILVFGGVGIEATDANSNYNALQIALTKKTAHGLEFQSSYTWSHSLDNTSSLENVGGGGALNPFDLRSNYGDSSYDARNRFVIAYAYEIPSIRRVGSFHAVPGRLVEGWRIAGATALQAGFPLGLSDSSDNALICWAYTAYGCPDRPNVVSAVRTYNPRNTNLVNSTHGGKTTRASYYFNPNSFAPEARGVLGNAGRNFFHGPGINNFDFALFKDTKVTERTLVQLRFEFFNLFNHTQFTVPGIGTDINSANFGRVSSAADPRIIQLASKFYF